MMKRRFSDLSGVARAVAGSFAILLLSWQNVAAQDWAKPRLEKSPRHREYVDIKSGDRTIKAFVVYPESKNKIAVVVVIHEIFGLSDWVKSLCDQLAENGVIAICPDLLSGQTYTASQRHAGGLRILLGRGMDVRLRE